MCYAWYCNSRDVCVKQASTTVLSRTTYDVLTATYDLLTATYDLRRMRRYSRGCSTRHTATRTYRIWSLDRTQRHTISHYTLYTHTTNYTLQCRVFIDTLHHTTPHHTTPHHTTPHHTTEHYTPHLTRHSTPTYITGVGLTPRRLLLSPIVTVLQ